MDKNTEINFVGQPVFKQIIKLLGGVNLQTLINKHNSDHYYKTFKTKTHLITMLFGILSRCDSMTEICEGLRAMKGKLNHLGLEQAPAKSTACDGLRNRSYKFFEDLYFCLVKHYQSFLSDSRTYGLTFKEVLLIDSTTIRLFSDILKGVGRNPKGDGNGKKNLNLKEQLVLRKVTYQDEKNRYFQFLTNNFEISSQEVAFLYKKRWAIELLFKKMKQNFQLHYFYGENENAIYTQVWCTLIAQLLLTVIQKMAGVKKAFSVVASLVRIHLISMLDVFELLRSKKRTYRISKPPPAVQIQFNF